MKKNAYVWLTAILLTVALCLTVTCAFAGGGIEYIQVYEGGPLWKTQNEGASSPEDPGKFQEYEISNNVVKPKNVSLGESRLPTVEEAEKLINNVIIEATDTGVLLTGLDGTACEGKSIFIPRSGWAQGGDPVETTLAMLATSTLYDSNGYRHFYFTSAGVGRLSQAMLASTRPARLVKDPATLTASATAYTGDYDGEAHEPEIEITVGPDISKCIIKYGLSEDSIIYSEDDLPCTDVGTYTVWYKVSAYGYANYTGSETVTINKVASSVTEAPEAKSVTYDGSAQELVVAGTADGGSVSYALSDSATSEPTTGWSADIPTGKTVGDYYVWYKSTGDKNHTDSDADCVTVTIGKREILISGITATDRDYEKDKVYVTMDLSSVVLDGKADGDDLSAMAQGKMDDDSAGEDKKVTITNLAIYGDDVDNYSLPATGHQTETTVTIFPLPSEITTAPEANSLTYNASAQELVAAGVAENGTVNYAIGTDDTTAPTSGWSTEIPTGTDAGEYYVWYKSVGDKNYADTTPAAVCVQIAEVPITSITVDPESVNLAPGETATVTATVLPAVSTETISWESGDDTIATVDANGKITAVADGTVTVTVKSTSGDVKAEVEVTVKTPVVPKTIYYDGDGVLFSNAAGGMLPTEALAGETVAIKADPADAAAKIKSVTVTTAGGKSVDVTDVGGGIYSFTMPDDNVTVKGTVESGSLTYAVAYSSSTVRFSGADGGMLTLEAAAGDFVLFKADPMDATETIKSVTATTDGGKDVEVITMSTMEGVTYRFTMPEDNVTVTAETESGDVLITKITADPTSLSLKIGESATVKTTVEPSNATESVVWESADTGIATVDENGKVTAAGVGTAKITVKSASGKVTAEVTVTVDPIIYTMIKGSNQTFLQNAPEATFSSDADYSKFLYVTVDGKKLGSGDYDSHSGSTVIVLKASFIKTLAVGTHTLKIVSTDGYATCKFTVREVPKTGDSSMNLLWAGGLVLALGGIAMLSRKRKATK